MVPGYCVACTLLLLLQKIFDRQKVLTSDECTPRFWLWFDLNGNTTARVNFPLEIPLFHLRASACNKSTDSPWWTDSKSRPKLAQRCAAPEGSRKLLPHRQVCQPDPPESHYGSTFLFTELINKNSRSHTVLHCPNLHDVWGLRHTLALEVRSSVRSQTSPPTWMIQLSPKTCLRGKLWKCTHGDVIISCCYRETVCKWDLKWLSCLPSSSSARVTHHCQQPAKQDEIKF